MTLFFTQSLGAISGEASGSGIRLLAYQAPGTNPSNTDLVIGHQPIFVMGCDRDVAEIHWICDSVRGATKLIDIPNMPAEITDADSVKSFNADGITVGPSQYTNLDSRNYRILSIAANSCLEIVTYSGSGSAKQVAHTGNGSGLTPASIWTVELTGWQGAVYHKSLGATRAILLYDDNAAVTDSTYWNDTAPTGSDFTVGTNNRTNRNGASYIAYLWYEIAGVSRIDAFTGDASDPGPTELTGFDCGFWIFKNPNANRGWLTYDVARSPANTRNLGLRMDIASSETTAFGGVDTIANGFQMRSTSDWINPNGTDVIYYAFNIDA